MASTPPSSHRRTFDLPKTSPDTGLAEWASKIKAIQQEVDRDEETEQRRLQEEITRSRMERARRRNTATGSIDWSKRAASPSNVDDTQLAADKRQQQSDALREFSVSTSPTSSPLKASTPSVSASSPSAPKPEGMSLAAFIGGRATGPKLNKPAPQQDSYDPTLFDQTRRKGPHSVFGQSSEALAAKGRFTSQSTPIETKNQEQEPKDLKTRESKTKMVASAPDALSKTAASVIARPPPEIPAKPIIYRKLSDNNLLASDTRSGAGPSQVRALPDVPTKPVLYRPESQHHVLQADDFPRRAPAASASPKPVSLAETIGGRASGPRLNKQISREGIEGETERYTPSNTSMAEQRRALPGLAGTQPSNPSSQWTSSTSATSLKSTPTRPSSQPGPRSDASSPNSASLPKRSFSGSTVLLARPVQPQAIIQPSPVAAASTTTSPAFLRAPPSTQDLHPSLSRLQGRGFVEKRVKASSELFGGSNPQPRERSTSSGSPNAGKRPTVLDRWQPNVASSSSPPPASVPDKPPNKSEPAEAAPFVSIIQRSFQPPTASPAIVKARISHVEETEQEVAAPVRLPGMTSASNPPKQWVSRDPADGKGNRSIVRNFGAAGKEIDNSVSTKPLSHPTRDRARKPRKAQSAAQAASFVKPESFHQAEPKAAISHISYNQRTSSDSPAKSGTRSAESTRPARTPSPEASRRLSPSVESNITRLKEALTYQAPSVIRPVAAGNLVTDVRPVNGASVVSGEGRRALPGMTAPSPTPPAARPVTPPSASSSPEVPVSPLSPSRHSRIPSTGQRATVMDVAQALQEHEQHIREFSLTPEPDLPESPDTMAQSDEEVDETPHTDVKAAIAGWGWNLGSGVQQAERRRSTYDRSSALPPLVEEKTPIATPQGSLSRGFVQSQQPLPHVQELHQSFQDNASFEETSSDSATLAVASDTEPREQHVVEVKPEPVQEEAEPLVHFAHQDKPPPAFNLQSVLRETPYSPKPTLQTISVEVLSISGHTAAAVTGEPNVFYDSEIVAVVHRAKDKVGGLVSSKVWAWRGKNAELGEKEERKVHELAERFGTTATHCLQGFEPPELIHVIGGVLAIRQGTRAHWTVENTAMHRIHRVGDSIFVDEVDLAISNLCSAYSYCLSVLDALYIWHGRGASEDERKIASTYAQSLATGSISISEFEEGAEDEMFWMMLGDDGFANADYWKFRNDPIFGVCQQDKTLGPRLYAIDSNKPKTPVQLISNFSGLDMPDDGVFVVDCRFELFVLVAPQARGKRIDIQLGLFLAENISAVEAVKRPFDPPIHVIILPSKLPLELRAAIRLCDEEKMNGGSIPEHMNILTLSEALDHMQCRSWPKSLLSDSNFLPLGIINHIM